MRLRFHGWMVLAGICGGSAWAGDASSDPGQAFAGVTTCAEARQPLARHPDVAGGDAHVEAICAAEAPQPRHEPDAQAEIRQWHRDNVAAIGQQVRGLMTLQDPRDQLAAALLAPTYQLEGGEAAGEWTTDAATTAFAAARRLGPDDPLVAWMEALDCPGAKAAAGCDPQAALQRLQRLEPDNAAVWLQQLQDGLDEPEVERILSRAAAAPGYQLPLGELGLLLYHSLDQAVVPPISPGLAAAMALDMGLARPVGRRDMAAIHAMALTTAVALPAYARLQHACIAEDDVPPPARRRPACIEIYTRMAQDPLLISQTVALSSLARLTAEAPDGAHWRERLRGLHWLWPQGLELVNAQAPADYILTSWRDGEMAALKGVLAAAGSPLAPPHGWLPENERLRSLITTGRPPTQD
ncbi:MAG: hypothetical protein KY442_07905 [Proteobacteria bacterium]|nr:hypothetical protein [Pseudomonadota bacterium]